MRPLKPALLVLLLAVAGCDDGPTDPDRTLSLTGTLTGAGAQEHPVRMGRGGNLKLRMVDATLTVPDTPPAASTLIVGLGQPGTTACALTTTVALVKGDVISYGLRAGNYCLTIGVATPPPTNGAVTYTVTAEIRE